MAQARIVITPFLWYPHAVGAFRLSNGTFYLDYNGKGSEIAAGPTGAPRSAWRTTRR